MNIYQNITYDELVEIAMEFEIDCGTGDVIVFVWVGE